MSHARARAPTTTSSARWPPQRRTTRLAVRAQASTATETPYARLDGIRVLRSTDGTTVPLRETWAAERKEKALLVLARSFGCPFCQATARELARDVLPQLQKSTNNQTRLVFVGIGTAERARDFAQRTGLPLDVLYADPDNAAYDALGLESSFAAAFLSPQTPLAIGKRAARSGGWEDLSAVLKGWEAWQPPRGVKQALNQGGAFLFDGAECVWSHRDAATAAHAEPGEMLERAMALAAKGSGDCGCAPEAEETAAAA
jgi:peroxiredoxin